MWAVGEESVVDQMCGGVDPLIELRLRHVNGAGEKAPEEGVHRAGQGAEVYAGTGMGQLVEIFEDGEDSQRGPGVDGGIFSGKVGVGEHGFLPGPVGADIVEIM